MLKVNAVAEKEILYLFLAFCYIEIPVKRVPVFFYVVGRIHSKQFNKLFPEVFNISDTYLHGGLGNGVVFFEQENSRLPEPDRPDKGIDRLAGNRFYFLV